MARPRAPPLPPPPPPPPPRRRWRPRRSFSLVFPLLSIASSRLFVVAASSPSERRGGGAARTTTTKSPPPPRPFRTWSHDEHCPTMTWTDLPESLEGFDVIADVDEYDEDSFDLVVVCVDGAGGGGSREGRLLTGIVAKWLNAKRDGLLESLARERLGGSSPFFDGAGGSKKAGSNTGPRAHRIYETVVAAATKDGGATKRRRRTRRYVLVGVGPTTLRDGDGDACERREAGRKVGSAIASILRAEAEGGGGGGGGSDETAEPTTDDVNAENDGTDDDVVESVSIVLPPSLRSSGRSVFEPFLSELSWSLSEGLYSDVRYKTGEAREKALRRRGPTTLKRTAFVLDSDAPPRRRRRAKEEDDDDAASAPRATDDAAATASEVADAVRAALQEGLDLSLGSYMARDVVNAPHNVLNSDSLADTARRIAWSSPGGCLTCDVLEKDDCERRGMGAYLGVARGSETPPKFLHLVYRPRGGRRSSWRGRRRSDDGPLKRLGVIGKGLLFDTGGYNIKTSSMELMKFDCGGAAAVLGAARSLAALGPEGVEVHFVVAACENMINDRAVVPGDVLTASNGKTIEVINTDAEGRLTMADALVYCDKELECERIVELSTLTGACMVSLGTSVAGLWTSDDGLAKELREASDSTGEKVWRMPLVEEYEEQLASKIADLRNLGTVRYGGAITAALFLRNFVDKKIPFAHVDMAGPVWKAKPGATGYGARLVTEWVRRQGKKREEEEEEG